jgi:copper chaperone
METKKMSVPNISCGHCVMSIKGVSKVEGDSQRKEITVTWDAPASLEKIKSTLSAINYPVAE